MKLNRLIAISLVVILVTPILLSTGSIFGFKLNFEVAQTITEEENDEKGSEGFVAAFYLEDYVLDDTAFFAAYLAKLSASYSTRARVNTVAMEVTTPPPELS